MPLDHRNCDTPVNGRRCVAYSITIKLHHPANFEPDRPLIHLFSAASIPHGLRQARVSTSLSTGLICIESFLGGPAESPLLPRSHPVPGPSRRDPGSARVTLCDCDCSSQRHAVVTPRQRKLWSEMRRASLFLT